jgi:DNA-directed RNA polymerase subunit RPC12/RpoP
MKEKNKSESNLSEKVLDSENYKFFTGSTCQKCNSRFPKQIVLTDQEIQCPECGTKAN